MKPRARAVMREEREGDRERDGEEKREGEREGETCCDHCAARGSAGR